MRVGYASIRHTQSAGVGAACFLPLVKSACYTIAHRNLMVSMSKQHAARRGPGRGGHNVTNYWEVGVWPLLCSMAPPLSTRPDGAPGDVGGAARVGRWGGGGGSIQALDVCALSRPSRLATMGRGRRAGLGCAATPTWLGWHDVLPSTLFKRFKGAAKASPAPPISPSTTSTHSPAHPLGEHGSALACVCVGGWWGGVGWGAAELNITRGTPACTMAHATRTAD